MKRIIRFLVPKNSLLWRVPRKQYQQANSDSRHAGTHERILIRQMYARNTREAKLLMKKYNASTAYGVIDAINRRKPTISIRLVRGLKKLVRKIEGSTASGVQIEPRRGKNRLP